jgi:lysophospholipase L1-like esterase
MPKLTSLLLSLALLLGAAGLAALPAAASAPSHPGPTTAASAPSHPGPTTAVELGDSYMSGEGGRWLGNSVNVSGSRDGTDRACSPSIQDCTSYDPSKVYIDHSYTDGCHRADVAQIFSSHLPVQDPVNIACSGAVSSDLYLSSGGGTSDHGEAPQSDQLLALARTHDVKFVAVMIGGNDLGFASIVAACFDAYETHGTPCSQTESSALSDSALHAAQLKVEKAIDQIRLAMRMDGYHVGDYRMVLENYPIVIPPAADARYAQSDPQRTADGCPFYDVDLNWAQDYAGPRIDSVVTAAAAARGVPLLDMHRAFVGHEICAKTDASVTPSQPPSPLSSEWGRALSPSAIAEGQEQEVFHPNAYGHEAFGTCLREFYSAPLDRNYFCLGRAGITPQGMTLIAGSALPAECRLGALAIRQPVDRVVGIRTTCRQVAGLQVVVRSGARRLADTTLDLRPGTALQTVRLSRRATGTLRVTLILRGTGGDVRRQSRRLKVGGRRA